jgi:F-type H+-transporting ATPase subunit epsilon
MSDKLIKFQIVTPERIVLEEEILQITVPTKQGEITVLPDHIPLVASLMPGVIEVKTKSGQEEIMSVSGGFIEVLKNKVTILADSAERGHEIDLEQAEQARLRAEELKEKADRTQFADISAQIEKELARTKAVKRWKKIKGR